MLQLLGVRPGEGRTVALLLVHYVWVVAVTIAGKSVRDTYFLSRYDRSVLPLMAVAAAIAVAVSVALFTRMENRLRSKILVPLVSLVFAASLAALHFRLQGFAIPVLYVWMEVINVVMILQFWLLASELLDSRQAKRLFPIIGGGGSLAAILIGPQLKPFSKAYGSDTLLWLVCALLLGSAAVAMATTRLPRVPFIRSKPSSQRGSWKRIASPYLLTISLIVVCAAVVSAIVDYQFKIISAESLRTETDLVGFFGQFYAATGLSTLVLQFIVASRAFQRFGVVLVMSVLPVTLGLGSMAILLWPVLWSAVLARFSDQTFRFTLHNGGLELLWLPVSPELRREAKPFVSGSLKSITEGAVGILIYVLLYFLTPAQLSIVAVAFCGLWGSSLFKLKSLYVRELQSAIASRRLPREDLEISATDALTVGVIDRTLSTGEPVQQLLALDLIADLPLTPWRESIRKLLEQGSPEIRVRILQMAASDSTIVTQETLEHLAAGNGVDAIEAIRAIGRAGHQRSRPLMLKRLDDVEPAVRAAACGTLAKLNGTGALVASERLTRMLAASDVRERVAALEESAHLDSMLAPEILEAALRDPSREVRAKALDIAGSRPDERYANLMVDSLKDPVLFTTARNALAALPQQVVFPVLSDQLKKEASAGARSALLRAMRICQTAEAYSVLLDATDGRWPVLANEASESLLAIARHMPVPEDIDPRVGTGRSDLLRRVCRLYEVHDALPDTPATMLLRDYLKRSIASLLVALIRLAALERPDTPIEACIQVLQTQDRARRPFVLELFDTLLNPTERERIVPRLERAGHPGPPAQAEAGSADPASIVRTWLSESMYSEQEWLRAIALDYILTQSEPQLAASIDWKRIPETPVIREIAARSTPGQQRLAAGAPETRSASVEDTKPMLTNLEKTILLKSVPLFEDIPGEELSRVAQIAEEQNFPAGMTMFRDGDHADCLYVIVRGSVSIRKRGRELAVLTASQSLGEMAVLDSSPRSADATTIEPTDMLRVGQEEFLEIMQSNTQIMKGVVQMLLSRLRRIDEKLAGGGELAGSGAGTGAAR
jgi:hypothetical protein